MPSYERVGSSTDQKEKSKLRRQSIVHSGHAFIQLELVDYKKRRVSAVDDLVRTVTETGVKFEVVSRQLSFEYDSDSGMWSAHVLDTDRNRDMLASHYDNRYWEIVGVKSGRNKTLDIDDVIANIIKRRDKLAEEFKKMAKTPVNIPNNPKDLSTLSEEELMEEVKRRQKINASKSTVKDLKRELSPAQKGAITRAKNIAKKRKKFANVTDSKRPDKVVESNNNKPVHDDGTTVIDSEFLEQPGVGVNRP